MVCDDYVDFTDQKTFHDKGTIHITPGLDEDIRKNIIMAAEKEEVKKYPTA